MESKIPNHIAIIMDGNGRWAEKRGLPRTLGHKEGANALRKIITYAGKIGVKYLTVYAFGLCRGVEGVSMDRACDMRVLYRIYGSISRQLSIDCFIGTGRFV